MERRILSKEYVMKIGIDFNKLWFEDYSDRILDKPEEEGVSPFTGLSYETYPSGNLAYYCHYKDGFLDRDFIEFYDDGKLKSIQYMKRGRIFGCKKIWYKNGMLKSESIHEYGICLAFKEWNEEGVLIKEKLKPTEEDMKLRNSQEEWYKNAIDKE